ncbi:MAG: 30S ribosomal protein S20 [Ardenticatenia bacterium]|nr:30S ribosomal protein S20 [Ardenticatenia bacterium]
MPNTKSAKKRLRQSEKRRLRNRHYKGQMRSFVKRARQAIEAGDWEAAEELLRRAYKAIDKAASKGVIHKNNAARKKARLMAFYNRARAHTQMGPS